MANKLKTLEPEQPFLTVQQATWSGPLPPPAAMAEYDRIYAGAAKTILDMAQAEQSNRLSLEKQDIGHRMWMEKAGLITGFTICMTGIFLGAMLVYYGKGVTGFGVFLGSIGALVTAMIYKNKNAK
jgi:uncharacterized membrane protein